MRRVVYYRGGISKGKVVSGRPGRVNVHKFMKLAGWVEKTVENSWEFLGFLHQGLLCKSKEGMINFYKTTVRVGVNSSLHIEGDSVEMISDN